MSAGFEAAQIEAASDAYRLLFERASETVCLLDLEGRFVAVNPAGERLTGFSAAELAGRFAVELIDPELRENAVRQFQARLRDNRERPSDNTVLVARDGRRVPIEVSSKVFEIDGRPAGVLGLVADRTAKEDAEKALRQSEERFRVLLELAPDGIVYVDSRGRIVLVNAQTEELFGYPRDELVGKPVETLLPEKLHAVHQVHRAGYSADPRRRNMGAELELAGRRKDGSLFPVDVSLSPLETANGRFVTAAIRDVTARKQAEADLRDAEARFRSVFEFAPIGEAIVSVDGRFLEVNDALCEIVGYSKPELVATTFQELTHPDDLAVDLELVRQTLVGERRSFQLEKRYFHRLGRVVWVLLSVSLVRTSDGKPSYFISQIQDISERKAAQEAVAQSETRLAEAQHIARVGSWESDFATGRIAISQELCRLFELDPTTAEVRLEQLIERIHPDDHSVLSQANTRARLTDDISNLEYRIVLADGSVRWIHARGEPLLVNGEVAGRRGTSQDITERKEAEAERDRLDEQFHQAQKLEAVGQLAGGIAHDFNNMLTAIKGYSELLLNELQPGTSAHAEAAQIQRAAEQAATLPAQLLAFGRAQPLEPQLCELNGLVTSAGSLLEHLLSEAIELIVDPADHPIYVQVDSARVETALVNLAVNARDAMPAGGTLTIRTGVVELDDDAASEHQVAPGRYSVVSVADNGSGMGAETAARAFEPFFTTKPHGQGSGLGLASVYGTVRQSGGFVRLQSHLGQGTVIELHLPVAAAPVATDEPQTQAPPTGDVAAEREAKTGRTAERGPAREARAILVAEDEDVVRELVVRLLSRDGYVVHAAAGGAEALGLLDRLERPIDVLLTDMVMPGMGGRELAEQIRRRSPDTPVVFMSGYTEEAPALDGDQGSSTFLVKPFSSAALRDAVKRAVAQAPAAAALPRLTSREQEVLALIATGNTNEMTAAELGISPETVQTHVKNAMQKLEAETRTQAVATALRHSLIR